MHPHIKRMSLQKLQVLIEERGPVMDGHAVSASVAAAGAVARVTRDRYMIEMDKRYPGAGFARHKGHGTREHLAALVRCGPCPIHRRMAPGARERFPLPLGQRANED